MAQGLHMLEMGLVMMGLQMAKWVVWGEGGMAPITAPYTNEKENVTSAATWWKPLPFILTTLI